MIKLCDIKNRTEAQFILNRLQDHGIHAQLTGEQSAALGYGGNSRYDHMGIE